MHHHRDALWCIITVMHHRYDVSTWCIKSVIRDWLYVTFYWYDAYMMCWDTVGWMLMHKCWLINDECWCMNVDNEWWVLMINEWWMLMDEWWMNDECWWMNDERIWVLMHVDECEMYIEWCMMHLRCGMHWCMLNRLMCVKCMYIFCNYNCMLYWFCNCSNVLILIFVFVCLSGLQ